MTFKGRRPALPAAARPTRTTRGDGSLEFAGQQIDYGYLPAAHTDGDIYVHFPKMNLLVAGGSRHHSAADEMEKVARGITG